MTTRQTNSTELRETCSFDALIRDFAAVPAIRRLRDVSFLGAIDASQPGTPFGSGSRLDHVIGVARITESICKARQLTTAQTSTCIAVAMLHDIGHTIFSHSGERYLKFKFRVDHNEMTKRKLFSEIDTIRSVARKHDVNMVHCMDYITHKINYKNSYVDNIFNNPLNPDTIEGIFRSATYFREEVRLDYFDKLIEFVSNTFPAGAQYGDYFWALKDKIYNQYIYSDASLQLENVLERNLKLIDLPLEKLYGRESAYRIASLNNAFARAREILPPSLCIAKPKRVFAIDKRVQACNPEALKTRYLAIKE